jgi:hypothetical protein
MTERRWLVLKIIVAKRGGKKFPADNDFRNAAFIAWHRNQEISSKTDRQREKERASERERERERERRGVWNEYWPRNHHDNKTRYNFSRANTIKRDNPTYPPRFQSLSLSLSLFLRFPAEKLNLGSGTTLHGLLSARRACIRHARVKER